MSSILIKNARLRGHEELCDLYIKDGVFAEIAPGLSYPADETIDVAGKLVSAPFCDAHLHLDAVLSVGKPRYNMSGTLIEGINIWGERMQGLTKETIKKNARDVIKWEVANGSMFLRTHADATEPTGTVVEALLEVHEEMKDLVDLQIVAFPQECIFTAPGHTDLMENALKLGCDVVGGLPYMEYSPEDGLRDVKYVFDLAEKYGALIDIHCDENTDDQSRYVEAMARETIVRGMQGRVTASHTTAMHNYNNDFAFKLMGFLKKAQMNMVTNPFANSCLQNRTDGYPRHRGHTRVDELLANGIIVCIGSDDIMDPWYPMGKGSPLAGAALLMNYAQLSGYPQVAQLIDMITCNSARTMCLTGYGLEVGNPANLIVLDAESEFDAIRLQSECLYVIRRGRVVCRTVPARRTLEFEGRQENIDFRLTAENL